MLFDKPFGGLIPGAQGAVLSTLMHTGTPLTGRQVHSLLSDEFSLWTVQEALKTLARLGLVTTQTVGRAGLHSVNDEHSAIEPLRKLLSPMSVLKEIIQNVIDSDVKAVIVFGSVARRQPGPESDIDLAVIAVKGWDDRALIQKTVHARLGNACDVVAFTPAEFSRLAADDEPVVAAILTEGVPLIGSMPRIKRGGSERNRGSL